MPILRNAKKTLRADERKSVVNLRRKRSMKSAMREVSDLLKEGKPDEARKLMPKVQKAIDKTRKGGIIKKKNAARKLSRLSAKVKKASSK